MKAELPHFDYYVASRWRNKDIVLELVAKLRAKGKKVYSFFENKHSLMEITKDPEETMAKYESTKDWWDNPSHKQIFLDDMQGIQHSDALILLLPAGKSSHIEAGVAYGFGKHMILIGEQKEAESLYHIFHEHYSSIEGYIAEL